MSVTARNLKTDIASEKQVECYRPQSIPKALKVIQGKRENLLLENRMEAKIVTLESFKLIALKAKGRMNNFELGSDVRRAWKELINTLNADDTYWSEKEIGYVFYPQGDMRQPDGTLEMKVGVKVDSFATVPSGVQKIILPARKYAMTTCRCYGREQMDRSYQFLHDWIEQEGYQIDYSADAYTLEPNRLSTFDPFDIPADAIQQFDFDIYYPIK